MKGKNLTAIALSALLALGISAPAWGAEGNGTDDVAGRSEYETKVDEKALEDITTGVEKSADETGNASNQYKNDMEKGGKEANAKEAASSPVMINPRGYQGSALNSTNYWTACYSYAGSFRYAGACDASDEDIWGYYTATTPESYDITTASFTYDYGRPRLVNRGTRESKVGGNPSVSCAPKKTGKSGGKSIENNLRLMTYTAKWLEVSSKGSTYKPVQGGRYYSWVNASNAMATSEAKVMEKMMSAQSNTNRLKNEGYFGGTSESSSAKKLVGCYYDTKMTARVTAWWGNAKCVVGLKYSVVDSRSGRVVAEKSVKTAYGNAPSVETCKGSLTASIPVDDIVPDEYGRYMYKRVLTYDNPELIYTASTGKWTLKNPLVNTNDAPRVIYFRNTCNPAWSGRSATPLGDTVSKDGADYSLTYSQNDCKGISDEKVRTSCAYEAGNDVPAVAVEAGLPGYSEAGSPVVESADGKLVIPRNGLPAALTWAIPKIAVSNSYAETFGGAMPQGLSVKDSLIRKNESGTPWASNSQVRGGVPLDAADKADFTLRETGKEWLSHLENLSRLPVDDSESYYGYRLANGANKVEIASRWESAENAPTRLRSDYTIEGSFPYMKTKIGAVGVNGRIDTFDLSVSYAKDSLRCVSSPLSIDTVRAVN